MYEENWFIQNKKNILNLQKICTKSLFSLSVSDPLAIYRPPSAPVPFSAPLKALTAPKGAAPPTLGTSVLDDDGEEMSIF